MNCHTNATAANVTDSNWKWPDIPGLHDFGGKLLHSATWDSSYDFKNRTVVVIGSGSSAIQIVPQLQPGKSTRSDSFEAVKTRKFR